MQQYVNGANILQLENNVSHQGGWKPGQSGNPGGRPKDKPFKDALRMEALALANGETIKHPPGSWRSIAQAMLLKGAAGDVSATNFVVERIEGKVPQAIVGDASEDAIAIAVSRGDEARLQIEDTLKRIASRVIIDVTPSSPDGDAT